MDAHVLGAPSQDDFFLISDSVLDAFLKKRMALATYNFESCTCGAQGRAGALILRLM